MAKPDGEPSEALEVCYECLGTGLCEECLGSGAAFGFCDPARCHRGSCATCDGAGALSSGSAALRERDSKRWRRLDAAWRAARLARRG